MAYTWLLFPSSPTKSCRQGGFVGYEHTEERPAALRQSFSGTSLHSRSPGGARRGSPQIHGMSRSQSNGSVAMTRGLGSPSVSGAAWLPDLGGGNTWESRGSATRISAAQNTVDWSTSRNVAQGRPMSQGATRRKIPRRPDGPPRRTASGQLQDEHASSRAPSSGLSAPISDSPKHSSVGRISKHERRPIAFAAHGFPVSPASAQSRKTGDKAAQEYDTLQDFSVVASDIIQSLDDMGRSWSNSKEHREEDALSSSLKEIRNISHIVHAGLMGMGGEGAGKGTLGQSKRSEMSTILYDDDTLVHARELTALTRRFCQDLELSRGISAELNQEGMPEVASLNEISNATKKVCEEMSDLQCDHWAAGALNNVIGVKGDNTSIDVARGEEDGLPSSISTHPSRHNEQSVPKRDSLEEPIAEVHDSGASSNQRKESADQDYGDVQAFIAQQQSEGDEISEADIKRWQIAFKRFKVPDSSDLHTGDVLGLLEYLGHLLVQQDIVSPLIKEVTNFDYLDFDEFIGFMERFLPREKHRFEEVFRQYDEDGSGKISVAELRRMLHDLGFIPLQAIMREALSLADQTGNGELDFDEFQTFIAVYRRFEGFTKHEVRDFRKIFDRFSAGGEAHGKLPAEVLGDALVQAFGVHVSEFAEEMQESLQSGQGLQKSPFSNGGGSGKAELLAFSEFLIFARKIREASLSKMKAEFGSKFSSDRKQGSQDKWFGTVNSHGDGLLSIMELRELIKGLGYTPLQQILVEVLTEVDKDQNESLDFDEFFDFMMIFRQREGFSIAEVAYMKAIFERFDQDGSGEISALELAEIFRELGYRATLDEIHVYVLQVDANCSNQLDIREFFRLMRLHREEELKTMLTVFDLFKLPGKKHMGGSSLPSALEALGHDLGTITIDKLATVDFEQLVQYADIARAERVRKEKKKAGFADEQIARFQDKFNHFDKDGSGEIDRFELLGILKEFHWQPKTREEQRQLVDKLEAAQGKAKEAGVPNAAENGSIDFWTFVQLCRILETEHDRAAEERLNRVTEELRFEAKEVEEFRHIFHTKTKSMVEEGVIETPDGLPRQAVKRLIFLLGITIKGDRKAMLDDRLDGLGCVEETHLDFEGFLKLMRWLMDTGWRTA